MFTQISNSRSFFPVVSCSLCSSLWSHEHVRSISLIAQVVGLLPDCYRLSDCCWIVIGLLSDCYRIVTGYRIVVGLLSDCYRIVIGCRIAQVVDARFLRVGSILASP